MRVGRGWSVRVERVERDSGERVKCVSGERVKRKSGKRVECECGERVWSVKNWGESENEVKGWSELMSK